MPSSSMMFVKKSFEGQQAATLLGHSFNPSSIRNALIMQVKTIDAPMFDKPGQEETPDAMKLRDRSLLNAVRLSFENIFFKRLAILLFFSKCANLVFEIVLCRFDETEDEFCSEDASDRD